MKPTAKIILDRRRALDNRKYPVKIRVAFHSIIDGAKKLDYAYCGANDEMFEEEFAKLYKSNALQPRLNELMKLLNKATTILDQKPLITKAEFNYLFTGKGNYESVHGQFEILEAQADKNGQVSTAGLMQTTRKSLTNYVIAQAKEDGHESDGTLVLGQINIEFLEKYEAWLIKKGLSYNTIGIYTRYIRELFNFAIDKGLIGREAYPFGRGKFIPPATIGRKIALTQSQVRILLQYKSDDPKKQKALDLWKFSYYCFGLNFKDICQLKWNNIEESMGIKVIRVYRAKTFGRKRIKKKHENPITEQIQEIISKYSQPSLNPEAYIFNFLTPGLSPKQIQARKNDLIKETNGYLSEISEELALPKVTTYVARHSFGYMMKISGVSIAMRQEMLGHENQKTTEIYDRSFEIQDKLAASKFLYG
jgi:integrase